MKLIEHSYEISNRYLRNKKKYYLFLFYFFQIDNSCTQKNLCTFCEKLPRGISMI